MVPICTHALHSLVQLTKVLSLSVHQPTESQRLWRWSSSLRNPDCDVMFELDDGMTISSYRRLCITMSPVFAAMLDGHFVEREQSCVKVSACSSQAFQLLMNYCMYNSVIEDTNTENNVSCDLANVVYSLDLLLECLALGDRFVAMKFQRLVAEEILHTCINVSSAEQIIGVAAMHGCDWLIEQCLLFLLVSSSDKNVSYVARQHCFQVLHENELLWPNVSKALFLMIQGAL